jgi:propionyl-CoA carboxylase alpha chain
VDGGYEEGMKIPVQYDPLLAKLVVHAETRELAMDKMKRAIEDFEITGVETTLGFGHFVMGHEAFRSGNFNTRFIENYFKPEYLQGDADIEMEKLAAALAVSVSTVTTTSTPPLAASNYSSKWKKHRL